MPCETSCTVWQPAAVKLTPGTATQVVPPSGVDSAVSVPAPKVPDAVIVTRPLTGQTSWLLGAGGLPFAVIVEKANESRRDTPMVEVFRVDGGGAAQGDGAAVDGVRWSTRSALKLARWAATASSRSTERGRHVCR